MSASVSERDAELKHYRIMNEYVDSSRFLEQSWYILQVIGFRQIPACHYYIRSRGEKFSSKRHQDADYARNNIVKIFSDQYGYHFPKWNVRRKSIEISTPKICQRCGGTDRLEREHIIPLSKGGKDESDNLRYLCYVCHKFHHAEQDILYGIKQSKEEGKPLWHQRMWEYRLKVLRELNPVGQTHYVSYWSDPQTHYEKWYRQRKVKPSLDNNRIDCFFQASVSATGFES